jgi:hypothetical protein
MAEELLHDDGSRPAIHVSLAAGLDDAHFNWAAFGAEEEGVPCRHVPSTRTDPVAMAYDAAVSSRFGVGIGISAQRVVVHELHMPAEHPVVAFDAAGKNLEFCRLAGSNAARLIVRLPLRFALEAPPVSRPQRKNAPQPQASNPNHQPASAFSPEFDPALIKAIAKVVAQIVQERGIG